MVCQVCRWYELDKGSSNKAYGWCHFMPPSPRTEVDALLPRVFQGSFCSKWEEKKSPCNK